MKELMQDHHRERIIAQIEREKKRQSDEEQMIRKSRDAKVQISAELRSKIAEAKQQEAEKKRLKIESMKARREQRDNEHVQKLVEAETIAEKRKVY